ncbi:unnamed protein product [Brassicogethes aeneus]|uniref:Zasp-like motif domain-containing protein n=1 Tax=Brassicogethes aeneus TaxID=1431903 RepID=A0A9P0FM56_BRAAE|nr:unnamed protein product [Brassicogethes aeneus]
MATQPRLVNKQFNSPIGLYSDQNVREVLDRETQILSNGAVGVNFYNPNAGKAANLQNSAVLRMLEEEENRQRNGHHPSHEYAPRSLRESSVWPPKEYEVKNKIQGVFKDTVVPGVKRVAWPPPEDSSEYTEQAAVQTQGGAQYPTQSPGLQNNHASNQAASPQPAYRPLHVQTGGVSPSVQSAPSPLPNLSPAGFRPATPSKQWAPVQSPVGTPTKSPQFQPQYQQYQPPPQQYQPQQQYQPPSQPQQQYQPPTQIFNQSAPVQQAIQPSVQAPAQQQQHQQQFQQQQQQQQQQRAVAPTPAALAKQAPPPTTIQLRPQAPVSQAPAPLITSQPATATLKGGKHLRGDLKWPPEDVKKLMEEEKKHLEEIAMGPACKPHKNIKDYSGFYAQHQLNDTYPRYVVPPGTQYFRPL